MFKWLILFGFLTVSETFTLKKFHSKFGDVFIKNIPKSSACHILKERQVDAIWYDVREKEVEFDKAKIWCKYHMFDERYSTSIVSAPGTLEYFVLYRQSGQVFTIEDLVRVNPVSDISVENVYDMLRSECDTMGYLQLPRSGRYTMEVTVEHMYQPTIVF